MSSKKTHKFNKLTNKIQHVNKNQQQQQQYFNSHEQLSATSSTSQKNSQPNEKPTNDRGSTTATGLAISMHKTWPDLQLNQSALFFECTLFLYSVLALFLQYLNLYKTLWWLPKSYYHYSLKYHLINPYLLSCIGLLLGIRVTKCFWNGLSDRVDYFCKDQGGLQLTCWKIFEYAIVKTPLTTIVCTSFLFSFSRIYLEFGINALIYFFAPLILYIALFHIAFSNQLTNFLLYLFSFLLTPFEQFANKGKMENKSFYVRLSNLAESIFHGPESLLDDSVVHLCSDVPERIRQEANILLVDFELRCRYCVYTGLLTAYFGILLPRSLLPMKTNFAFPQHMLIDDIWVAQLFIIVAFTACSLYITYLFPINYFDLLYRCVVHLGYWERIKPFQLPANNSNAQFTASSVRPNHGKSQNLQQELYTDYQSNILYEDGTKVVCNGAHYIARSHPHLRTVAAEPGNEGNLRLYRIAKDPIQSVTYLCIFQASLVAFEFWLLLLTSDWQQIVTLVLLMFANYLLLAKMFKDRIIIGRIYNPSEEDLQMIKQLKEEMDQKKTLQK